MLVRDTPTAEEAVQDAFVAIRGAWPRLGDADKALAYLRQAVVNRSRSVLRHRLMMDEKRQKGSPTCREPSTRSSACSSGPLLWPDCAACPSGSVRAIILRYYAHLSEAEIGAIMGISRGAVKSHAARGMAALREALERDT